MMTYSPESQHAASLNETSRRTELLQELAAIASGAANKQIDTLATRISDALLRRASELGATSGEGKLCTSAAQLLRKNRYPFHYVASERLAAALQHEARLAADPSAAQEESGGAAKSLEPDVEIDKKLSLLKAGKAIENEHAERFTALNMRLARLFEQTEFAAAKNPFRPQVFLSAIHEAWCEFNSDAEMHPLLFPLLGPALCIDMGPVLHVLNAMLIKRGILPDLDMSCVMPNKAKPVAEQQQAASNDPLVQKLRGLFPSEQNVCKDKVRPQEDDLPTLFQEEQLRATVSHSQLLAYLAEIQKNGPAPHEATGTEGTSLFAHIKQWAPQGTLAQADAATIDLLSVIFDTVFRTRLSVEIKTLIGSLQIPILKASLNDRDFFFKPDHPARRVIELLTQLGAGWEKRKGPNDPLYQTLLRNIKRIQSDQRLPSFSAAAAELQDFLAKEDEESVKVLSTSITEALKQEKLRQATKAAKHEVAARIGTGEVVAFVETFLEDKWVSVLTLAYAVQDTKPQVVQNAVKTMDDLCWSVKPKITKEERKELVAKLPSIVAMLNKWLDAIKWNDSDRVRFFDDLAKCHASIVRAPLELSPERQVQLAVAVAKKAAERRLERQAHQKPEPVPDEFDKMVGQLERGAWMEFKQQESLPMKVRLAWVSPMRNLFIFATSERKEALSISTEDLAQALREKRARVVSLPGLVGHALGQALGMESANHAAMEKKSMA